MSASPRIIPSRNSEPAARQRPGDWHVTDKGKPDGPAAELADVVIRCFDMAARYGIDLESVLAAKHTYNVSRPFQHGGRVLNGGTA